MPEIGWPAPGRIVLVYYPCSMRFSFVLLSGCVVTALCLASAPCLTAQTAPDSTPGNSPGTSQTVPPAASVPESSPPAARQTAPAPLQLHNLPADPHTPTAEELAAQAAARQRAQIQQLAVAENNWGPKASAPGMSLTLKEISRSATLNGTQIAYHIMGVGFTPDMKLALVRWPLNGSVTTVMDGIVVNSAGLAVCGEPAPNSGSGSCSKTMKTNEPVEVTATAAKGEAVRAALIATDKKHGAAVSFVPFPVEATDKGCTLRMLLGTKNAELVLIEGDGFKSGDSTFSAGSESYGVKRPLSALPNADGHFAVAMTAWVEGHDTGDTVVYVQSAACTTTLSFHWGKDTYKPE